MPILSSGRALLDAPAILRRAGLAAGMRYADLGCGPLGHFVFPAAELVGPDGRVYAVDVLKSSLASIESRLRMEAANNVSLVWGDFERENGVAVPPASLHLVSVVNIIPALMRSPSAGAEIARIMRPDGRLLLVDWKRERAAIGPPEDLRVSAEEAGVRMADSGFAVSLAFDAGPHHWARVFEKKAVGV